MPRGSFIGEISYITNEGASADVIADVDATYIEWTNKELKKIKIKPTIKRKLFAMEKIKYSIIKIILSKEILAKIPCAEKSL